jgi:hypothetical protein
MQDCPDGNYASLERSGKKQRSKPFRELYNGITNYRMWGLAACYAYTFGVEVGKPRSCATTASIGLSLPHAHAHVLCLLLLCILASCAFSVRSSDTVNGLGMS